MDGRCGCSRLHGRSVIRSGGCAAFPASDPRQRRPQRGGFDQPELHSEHHRGGDRGARSGRHGVHALELRLPVLLDGQLHGRHHRLSQSRVDQHRQQDGELHGLRRKLHAGTGSGLGAQLQLGKSDVHVDPLRRDRSDLQHNRQRWGRRLLGNHDLAGLSQRREDHPELSAGAIVRGYHVRTRLHPQSAAVGDQ